MVNNYPEYAAGVNYKKTDSNDITHFYSAQVVADPSDDTIESKLIKDGVVISEGGPTVEALNVTENGTYSEEGKAYSPVVVNVAGGGSVPYNTAMVTVKTAAPISGPDGISGTTFTTFDVTPELPENYTFDDETPILINVKNSSLDSLTAPITFEIIYGEESGAGLRLTCDRVGVDLSNSTYSGDITWDSDTSFFIITGDCEININNA